jgi:hypothetical protein
LPELLVGEVTLHQRQTQPVEALAVCLQAIVCRNAAEGRKGFTATLPQQCYISGGSSSLGASRTGIVPDDDLLAASATVCARLCDSSHFKCLAMSRSALFGRLALKPTEFREQVGLIGLLFFMMCRLVSMIR